MAVGRHEESQRALLDLKPAVTVTGPLKAEPFGWPSASLDRPYLLRPLVHGHRRKRRQARPPLTSRSRIAHRDTSVRTRRARFKLAASRVVDEASWRWRTASQLGSAPQSLTL